MRMSLILSDYFEDFFVSLLSIVSRAIILRLTSFSSAKTHRKAIIVLLLMYLFLASD